MKQMLMGCLTAACLSLIVGSTSARADEEKVPLDKVPKEVMEAVKKKFPDAKIVAAVKEVEDGKTSFEVTIKDKEQNIDVVVTAEGKITAIETIITEKDLPKEVTAALNGKYPKAEIKKAEKIVKDDMVNYEVAIVTADKKKVEVLFDAKGKILEEEKNDKEEKKKDK